MTAAHETELRLIAAYTEQIRLYDRALTLAGDDGTSADWASAVNLALQEVALLDANIADDKTVWRSCGHKPGRELGELLDGVASRIAALARRLDLRVADLRARRERLMPEMDAFILQRRTLHAYGKLSP